MKATLFLTASILALTMPLSAMAEKTSTLTSPDGKLKVEVTSGSKVTYSVTYDGTEILKPSEISMTLSDGTVFGSDKKASIKTGKVNNPSLAASQYMKKTVDEVYNYLTLKYKKYDIEFRAYDKGLAYRFVSTAKKGSYEVMGEQAEFSFAKDWNTWIPYVREKYDTFEQQFHNSFENYYEHAALSQTNPKRLAFLPLVVDADNGIKVCITESDLYNYPGMYLNGGSTSLKGVFTPYPETEEQGGHNNLEITVTSFENYIAKAQAGQSFPWRIISVVPEAKDLTNLDLTWLLGRPQAAGSDFSWVRPGKVAWDWWNDWNLYGVDFRAGINNETYKYYIDFAAAHGIEYVILDEGWAVNKKADLFQVIPEINLEELVSYANSKNVGLILWAGYKAVERDIEGVCKHFSEMGIKGFKVDFMNRDDQKAVEFFEDVAKTAAKYHLLIDFHGAFKPQGIQRAYPNVLNFEGVAGLEQMKWGNLNDHPEVDYDVTIPFIRMAAGSLDYTQGAMRNATKGNYRPVNSEPMSPGTRCHQLGEYAIFFAPLTMLCDSPSNYMNEPECTEFIASFPTTWDETVPVCGEIGQYVAMARRKGNAWYVGALTNWDARDLTLDLSFIGGGTVTAFQDGINADRAARDYKKVTFTMPADGKVKIHMAPGGGWAAIIK